MHQLVYFATEQFWAYSPIKQICRLFKRTPIPATHLKDDAVAPLTDVACR